MGPLRIIARFHTILGIHRRSSILLVVALGVCLSCTIPLDERSLGGEGSPTAAAAELTAHLTWFRHDSSGPDEYLIEVQSLDLGRAPLPRSPLSWVAASPLDSVAGPALTGMDGRADIVWRPHRLVEDGARFLEIRSGTGAVVRLATASAPSSSEDGTALLLPGSPDTVGATVREGVRVEVVDAHGRPVPGVPLRLEVPVGSGSTSQHSVVTDRVGRMTVDWHLGTSAGSQSVSIRFESRVVDLQLRDVRSGQASSPGSRLTVRRTALPASATSVTLADSSLAADAVGAQLRILAAARDKHGNVVLQPRLHLATLDSSVVQPQADGTLRTTGPGSTMVRVNTGDAVDTLRVTVTRRPVTLQATSASPLLTRIGGRTDVSAAISDRLGSPLRATGLQFRSLTTSILGLAGVDSVVALAPGTGSIEVGYGGLYDTVTIAVAQVPASVVLARAVDTMDLDQVGSVPAQVFDSGGTLIVGAPIRLQSDDVSRVAPLAADSFVAALPGEATLKVISGRAQASYRVTVEGVALLVDGVRTFDPAAVAVARSLELINGRVRLRWHPGLSERGGFEMDVRTGATWNGATVRGAGDWLYVTSTVLTEPTSITVVDAGPAQVAIAMRFGNHRFDPVLAKYPSYYQNEPFPFTRTLWLRPREYGYFSWTEIERTMVWPNTELEIGFGGMFGPATIRTGAITFQTDTLHHHNRFNVASVPDAAELDLRGDPLMRVLVPLPEAPMISPLFPGWGYGSVYVHRSVYESYGAYLYAAPRALAVSPRQTCANAWTQAPFTLRALTAPELAACGAP